MFVADRVDNLRKSLIDAQLDALLLNPRDPGWGSSRQRQLLLLRQARAAGWTCQRWDNGLELCQKNDAPRERS